MSDKPSSRPLRVFTIGHSNHPLESFLRLLREHTIEVVADVRSSPHSGYAPGFNREAIEGSLRANGIEYRFLGNLLGGRPPGEEFYDGEGHVLYDELRQASGFQAGIESVLTSIRSHRVALLCGEEDPANCHRRLLIGRVLRTKAVEVVHIRGDGHLQTEEELAREEEFRKTKGQMSLFGTEETEAWKSTQSVSRKRAPPSSSKL